MAEGTRYAQLSEIVAANKETLNQHTEMLKTLMEQVSLLATTESQNQNQSGRESSSNPNGENQGENSGNIEVGRDDQNDRIGGIQTRTVKLDFPRFDGTEPVTWILKAQQFFTYSQTPENQKVPIAAFHMEGRALTWYHWLMDAHTGGWEEFVFALKTRFAPSAFDDPVGAFTKLKQTSTVEDYQVQFEILSNRIQGMSEEFKVSTFLSGLKEEVRIMVTMLKPITLSSAFGLAKLQEEEVRLRGRGHKYQSWVTNSQGYTKLSAAPTPPRLTIPTPPETRNTNPPYNPNFNRRPSIPIKRLTPAQMQERREKGLCYNCDEKFQPGHRCNRPRLFLLEGVELGEPEEIRVEEVEPEEESEGEPQGAELLGISMHALAGALAPRTMRLMGGKNIRAAGGNSHRHRQHS